MSSELLTLALLVTNVGGPPKKKKRERKEKEIKVKECRALLFRFDWKSK